MNHSLLPLKLTASLFTLLTLFCTAVVFRFWRAYGWSIALPPQIAVLSLMALLVGVAWFSYTVEQRKQARDSDVSQHESL